LVKQFVKTENKPLTDSTIAWLTSTYWSDGLLGQVWSMEKRGVFLD
jgi:hypothetical protein